MQPTLRVADDGRPTRWPRAAPVHPPHRSGHVGRQQRRRADWRAGNARGVHGIPTVTTFTTVTTVTATIALHTMALLACTGWGSRWGRSSALSSRSWSRAVSDLQIQAPPTHRNGRNRPDSSVPTPRNGRNRPDSGLPTPRNGRNRPDSGLPTPRNGRNRPDSSPAHAS